MQISIAVSYLVMILAVAVSSGYREELRDAISSLTGDVILDMPGQGYSSSPEPLDMQAPYMDMVRGVRGVGSLTPVVAAAGIARSGDDICGAIFKGVEGYDSLRIAIPATLSDKLGVEQGDRLTAYFTGDRVKVRNFTVAEVYGRGRSDDLRKTVLMGESAMVVYAGLDDMRRVLGWTGSQVSSVEVRLTPSVRDMSEDKAGEIGTIAGAFAEGDDVLPVVTSSRRRYDRIWAWLDIVDTNVLILLVLMTIVAGFNMISGLLILLFRSTSKIGILKSLGMTDRSLSSVFLRVSSRQVLKGMAIGNVLAILLCLVQDSTHVLRLDPENYMLSFVPVKIDIASVLAADAVSWVVIMLLLLIPCLFIARIDPSKTVRAQ